MAYKREDSKNLILLIFSMQITHFGLIKTHPLTIKCDESNEVYLLQFYLEGLLKGLFGTKRMYKNGMEPCTFFI